MGKVSAEFIMNGEEYFVVDGIGIFTMAEFINWRRNQGR